MADLDAELLHRVARWCAEAGRQAGASEIRRALAPLSWDELLAVRALLADPPPAIPLGPQALADIARGAPADVAAEREREGRYPRAAPPDDAPPPAPEPAGPAAGAPAARRRPAKGKRAQLFIRRAHERAAAPSPEVPLPPDVADLRRPEGRAVLERLVRRHGARRAAIVASLAAGWRHPGGASPGSSDLDALLDLHGMARAFERRERDELLHALRAAGGVRASAAASLGLDVSALEAALARLGASDDAERVRDARRADLRARATLSERVRLLLDDEARLRDLGLLDEFERDLRARLPEHLRALRAGREPLGAALGSSLSIPRPVAEALATRFGLDLGAAPDPSSRARTAGRGPRTAPPGRRFGAGPRATGAPLRPRGGKAPGGSTRSPPPPRASRGARPDERGPRRVDTPRGVARPERPGRPGPRGGTPTGGRGPARTGTARRGPPGSMPRGSAPRGPAPRGAAPRGSGPPRSGGPRGRPPRGR